MTVTHVRVTEAVESEGNTKSFKSKVRGGGECSLEDFDKQAMEMLMPGEASQPGPPKGGEGQRRAAGTRRWRASQQAAEIGPEEASLHEETGGV